LRCFYAASQERTPRRTLHRNPNRQQKNSSSQFINNLTYQLKRLITGPLLSLTVNIKNLNINTPFFKLQCLIKIMKPDAARKNQRFMVIIRGKNAPIKASSGAAKTRIGGIQKVAIRYLF